MSNVSENKQKITYSTITVDNSTQYWIIILSEINWEDLRKHFMSNTFFLTSFKEHEFKEKDVVLIYQKHSLNARLHGFVSICQIKENIGVNRSGTFIFKDKNME